MAWCRSRTARPSEKGTAERPAIWIWRAFASAGVRRALLRQIYLSQKRLKSCIARYIPEQWLTDDFDETNVLLIVCTFEPLNCQIVIVSVRVVHRDIIGVAVCIFRSERL